MTSRANEFISLVYFSHNDLALRTMLGFSYPVCDSWSLWPIISVGWLFGSFHSLSCLRTWIDFNLSMYKCYTWKCYTNIMYMNLPHYFGTIIKQYWQKVTLVFALVCAKRDVIYNWFRTSNTFWFATTWDELGWSVSIYLPITISEARSTITILYSPCIPYHLFGAGYRCERRVECWHLWNRITPPGVPSETTD